MSKPASKRFILKVVWVLSVVTLAIIVLALPAWQKYRTNRSLVAAIEAHDNATVINLLKQGADPNFAYVRGSYSLWEILKKLWDRDEPDPISILEVAIDHGTPESILTLLAAGARPNGRKDVGRYVPYLVSVIQRPNAEVPVIREMLARGAVVNDKDQYGRTALLAAAAHNRMDLVTLLLDHRADPNAIVGHSGIDTPLIEAIRHHNLSMTRRLLQAGAKTHLPYIGTPSFLGLAKGDVPLTQLLKSAGVME